MFDQANASSMRQARADLMNEIDDVLWDDMATLPLFQFQEMVALQRHRVERGLQRPARRHLERQ